MTHQEQEGGAFPLRFTALAAGLPCGLLVLAVVWLQYSSAEAQKKAAALMGVWSLHVALLVLLVGLILLGKPLLGLLGRTRIVIAGALLVGGHLACLLAPQVSHVFYEEHATMQLAQSISWTGRAQLGVYARSEYGEYEALQSNLSTAPLGQPYVLAWYYRLVGVSEAGAHFVNRSFVGLAAAALFLSLSLLPLALPRGSALAAALLFIFTPVVLRFGAGASSEPGAVALLICALLTGILHFRRDELGEKLAARGSTLALVGTATLASVFRPESLLVPPLLFVAAKLFFPGRLRGSGSGAALLLVLGLLIPHLVHFWIASGPERWSSLAASFGLRFVSVNLASNAGYFIDRQAFPPLGLILLVLGLVFALRNFPRLALLALVWFAVWWGGFLFFDAGGYYYGANIRFAVLSAAPLAVLMGLGLAQARVFLLGRPAVGLALASLGVLSWLAGLASVPKLGTQGSDTRCEAEMAREAVRLVNPGSLVISDTPSLWLVNGVNSVQSGVIEEMLFNAPRDLWRQYPGGIYLHWNIWASYNPEMLARNKALLSKLRASVVIRREVQGRATALFLIEQPFSGPLYPERVTTDMEDAKVPFEPGQVSR